LFFQEKEEQKSIAKVDDDEVNENQQE